MNGYEKDIRLERKFANDIKAILGNCFIVQNKIADIKEGTDFLVFQIEPIRVAARLRTFSHYNFMDRKNEFTIRWSRPSGIETEIDKIRDKKVQYLFYGFVDANEDNIIQHFIGDLDIFVQFEPEPIGIYPNNPRDSDLAVYKINQFPKSFIIASHGLYDLPKTKVLTDYI